MNKPWWKRCSWHTSRSEAQPKHVFEITNWGTLQKFITWRNNGQLLLSLPFQKSSYLNNNICCWPFKSTSLTLKIFIWLFSRKDCCHWIRLRVRVRGFVLGINVDYCEGAQCKLQPLLSKSEFDIHPTVHPDLFPKRATHIRCVKTPALDHWRIITGWSAICKCRNSQCQLYKKAGILSHFISKSWQLYLDYSFLTPWHVWCILWV